jgi:hypothetical protein
MALQLGADIFINGVWNSRSGLRESEGGFFRRRVKGALRRVPNFGDARIGGAVAFGGAGGVGLAIEAAGGLAGDLADEALLL